MECKTKGEERIMLSEHKGLQAAIKSIEAQFGKGAVWVLGEDTARLEVDVISTGSLGLNEALGIGGWPRGRICEVYGPESSGKSTLCLHAIAEAQKMGDVCAYIDVEHALDTKYAKALGVNTDELVVCQPDNGEDALEILDTLVKSGDVSVAIIDSVSALVPKAEIAGEMGDTHMGLQARLMSQAMRKLTHSVSASNCLVIFINQIRMKIGVFFGSPKTTSGGNALKFYASVRLEVIRTGTEKNKEEVIGNQTKIKVVKNKLAPPFKEVEGLVIRHGTGLDKTSELLDFCIKKGIIEKAGSWFSTGEERLGQGRQVALAYVEEHYDELLKKLEEPIESNGQTSMVE